MLDSSEEDLIQAARRGDGAAFAELIRPSYKPAFRIAYGMLQNHDEAEDAIQQASLKAWRRLANLREGTSMRPWFLGIVANQCRTSRRVGRWPASLDTASPTDLRLAIVLRFYADLPIDEVCQILGIKPQALESRLHRAKIDEQQLTRSFLTDFPREPRSGAYEHLRRDLENRHIKSRRTPFRLNPPEPSLRLLAGALIVPIVAATFVVGIVAYYGLSHGLIPAYAPHFSGTCSRGFQMMDATHGWNGVRAKTDDGGKTWSRLRLPAEAYGTSECIFDTQRAWMVSPIEVSPTEVGAYLFATSDRGETWSQAGSVPLADPNSSLTLEFIDSSRGWMLTESSPDHSGAPRTFYSTVDGGRNWTAVAEIGSGLQRENGACFAAGITFINPTTGWISFDCSDRGYGQPDFGDLGPTVILTTDGGRHWQAAALPGLPSGDSEKCSAAAPIFTGTVGVMPVFCDGPNLWSGVYRTGDGGRYWAAGLLPTPVHTSNIDFIDATTGYAYDETEHLLYRTGDSGRSWSTVTEHAFTNPTGPLQFDFIDARMGFAYENYYDSSVWKTVDGGKTWNTVMTSDSRSAGICPAYEKPTTPELVTMSGATSAWALGGLRTVDGGKHWTMAGPPDVPNRASGSSEFYLDANHAWVAETAFQTSGCDDTVYLFSTADGGLTWRQAAPIHAPLPSGTAIWGLDSAASVDSPAWNEAQWMDFIDPMHGWLMLTFDWGNSGSQGQPTGPIYRTTDGGATWSLMSNGIAGDFKCGPTPNLRFASPTTGWVGEQPCSTGPSVYVTHDAGATWQSQVLPLSCQCSGGTPVFFDRNHGFVATSDGQSVIMLLTLDGGQSWLSKDLPGDRADSVYFIDSNHGWLNGLSGYYGLRNLEYSRDGGDTWETMTLPPTPLYAQLTYRFADPTNGLLSFGDSLYRTVDSGWHWTKVNYEIVA